MKDNNYKYGRYINRDQETRWATPEEIRRSGTFVDLNDEQYPVAGLPLLSDAKTAYVDGEDTHTLIFGATGSKKTRLFCMPMLNFFSKAGESFIATDPKGELFSKTSGIAKANGYKVVALNFRDIGKGDTWNPLTIPYDLYHSGKEEDAISLLNDLVATLAAPQFERTQDVFWPQMASSFALGCLLLLMECATREEANLGSLAAMCSQENERNLKFLSDKMTHDSIAGINLRNVLSAADKTRQSIYVSLYGMVRIFTMQKNLTQMLSKNSMDISRFGREKTAVYIIVPDEKTATHFLVTTFIKQVYEVLIAEAQKEERLSLPVRVNFVLDEFCNIPAIPDMSSMISAARSRNMRFFLVAQSKHQLLGKYGEDADTIKGNCDNWVFLTSKELDLLNEISELCGSRYTAEGKPRRLISVSELQRLDKKKGEALIMHSRQYPMITEIADIDDYKMFRGFGCAPMDNFTLPKLTLFSLDELKSDVSRGLRPAPFSGNNSFSPSTPEQVSNPFDF